MYINAGYFFEDVILLTMAIRAKILYTIVVMYKFIWKYLFSALLLPNSDARN